MAAYRPSVPFNVPMILLVPSYTTAYGVESKIYPSAQDGIVFYGSFRTFGGTERDVNGVYTLAVLPKLYDREFGLNDDGSTEEDPSVTVDVFSSYDYGDVREYRIGDSMKRIHWRAPSGS